MKTKSTYLSHFLSPLITCIYFITTFFSFAQTIKLSSTSNQPISGAICPHIPTIYVLSDVPDGCVASWSATNGQLNYPNDGRTEMSVTWDDTPGVTATLKVTFSGKNCDASEPTPWSALILSVKDQNFSSTNSPVNVDYCTTNTVNITVPHMYRQGTGKIAA